MANTRNVTDRSERKSKKRALRAALKGVFEKLTPDQVRRFRKSETKGLRKFLASAK